MALVAAYLALMPVSIILQGWMTQTLWGWFITPAFGVPAPGIMTCFGFVLMVAALTPENAPARKDDEPDQWQRFYKLLGRVLGKTLAAVAVGWVVKLFV